MRLIDADELMEHVWRDKLDSRELIAEMIDNAPTVKEISTKIPIDIFEKLVSQEPCEDAISREYTMTALRADLSFICPNDQLNAIRIVEGMPPVTPNQKED